MHCPREKLPTVLCLPKSVVDDVNVEALVQEVRNVAEKAYEAKLFKDSVADKVKDYLKKAEDALAKKKYSEACKSAARAWRVAFSDDDHSPRDDDDDHRPTYRHKKDDDKHPKKTDDDDNHPKKDDDDDKRPKKTDDDDNHPKKDDDDDSPPKKDDDDDHRRKRDDDHHRKHFWA